MTDTNQTNPVMEVLQAAEQIKILTVLEQMLELISGQEQNFQFEVALKINGLTPMVLAVPAKTIATSLDNWGATITQELLNKEVPVDKHLDEVRQAVRKLKQQVQPQ